MTEYARDGKNIRRDQVTFNLAATGALGRLDPFPAPRRRLEGPSRGSVVRIRGATFTSGCYSCTVELPGIPLLGIPRHFGVTRLRGILGASSLWPSLVKCCVDLLGGHCAHPQPERRLGTSNHWCKRPSGKERNLRCRPIHPVGFASAARESNQRLNLPERG